MIQEKEFQARRETLAKNLSFGSVAVLFSAEIKSRSHDTEYPYRQDSNFYYLTGFKEESAALVIVRAKKAYKSYLFVQKKDTTLELWTGKRVGVKVAKKLFRVDDVFSIDSFQEKISEYIQKSKNIYFDFSMQDTRVEELREKTKTFSAHYNLATLIGHQRLIKSQAEIALIQKAIGITQKAHHKAMKESKKLKYEYELQSEIEYIFKKNGAYSDAYTSIVACGNSANTLHYIQNSKKLVNGELILIDAGCEYAYYASDITRTIPVSGKFSEAQKKLYEMVLDVEKSIIEMIQPGIYRSDLQKASERLLCEGMIRLGILKGSLKKNLKKAHHKKYYPHGIGHWMGLDVHDASPYKDERGKEFRLRIGMVMTIEPGIYIDKSDTSVPKKYRGIGIRIEDDILVTSNGYENLSKGIKKEICEIESLSS